MRPFCRGSWQPGLHRLRLYTSYTSSAFRIEAIGRQGFVLCPTFFALDPRFLCLLLHFSFLCSVALPLAW